MYQLQRLCSIINTDVWTTVTELRTWQMEKFCLSSYRQHKSHTDLQWEAFALATRHTAQPKNLQSQCYTQNTFTMTMMYPAKLSKWILYSIPLLHCTVNYALQTSHIFIHRHVGGACLHKNVICRKGMLHSTEHYYSTFHWCHQTNA